MNITVYGVASPDEARRLEAAGADVLGVLLGDARDGRVLDEAAAAEVCEAVSEARVCVEAGSRTAVSPVVAGRLGARWIQVPWKEPAPEAWREAAAAGGLGWVLGRVPADEDDDPEWVVDRWIDYGDPPPAWVHIEIFPNLTDGWPILLEASPDEVDAADLDRMAAERPIVFTAPLTAERVLRTRALLPHAHGFALTLTGHHGEVPGATTHDLAETLRLVAALRS